MAGNGIVQVPPNSTGARIDGASITSGAVATIRQRVVIGDNSGSAQFAQVIQSALSVTISSFRGSTGTAVQIIDEANICLKVRQTMALPAGTNLLGAVSVAAGTAHMGEVSVVGAVTVSNTVTIQGQVSVTGSVAISTLPNVNISAMPAVVIAAGASNIGFIDRISATVNVAGTFTISTIDKISAPVVLATGTNNIGYIDRISATVNVAGTFTISTIDKISATVTVAGNVSLAAGAANIGTLNNISAPVVIAAGTNNIGFINGISATVNVAGTFTIGVIDKISATVTVAGVVQLAAGTAHVGEVSVVGAVTVSNTVTVQGQVSVTGSVAISTMPNVNISAMPSVVLAAGAAHVGEVNISLMPAVNISTMPSVVLAAGANNIGTIQAISAGVAMLKVKSSASTSAANKAILFGWGDKFGRQIVQLNHPSLVPSASHGPKTVTISTSAGVTLIAAPGAGLCVYVDSILATNGGSTLTRLYMYEASASTTPILAQYLAANGGGFSHKFDPPWQVSVATALNMNLTVNESDVLVTVHFHVGPA